MRKRMQWIVHNKHVRLVWKIDYPNLGSIFVSGAFGVGGSPAVYTIEENSDCWSSIRKALLQQTDGILLNNLNETQYSTNSFK